MLLQGHHPSQPQGPRISAWRLVALAILFQLRATEVSAHVAAWNKGMYCLNGTKPNVNDQNTGTAVKPLYGLRKEDWWFHHVDFCDQFPPAPGDFLELPANGEFTVELANNRAFTTLSYNGKNAGLWTDGKDHPHLGETIKGESPCITSPNIHTQNETMAAGTVFAISYVSELSQVTEENLVVFTALYHTPWHRIATYQVPNLPACPEPGGCICAWGWVANGCGEPNMYMLPYRCRVTRQPGDAAVAPGRPPVWCEDDQNKCVRGAKQMVFWNQLDGNNVVISGDDLSGRPKSPGYNRKMGFSNGAQTDIFLGRGTAQAKYVDAKMPPSSGHRSISLVSSVSSTSVLSPSVFLCYAACALSFVLYHL
ncbi:hypothetical protein CPB84DRAFT_1708032 [Gymnopilus junonius]|uniref:Uncharacterized protein n=1 Tax=Gymnopilus junonius TaxID=109634 RepID=A0A9P5TNZ7_GYMJU|nr:hypothetical protein CPB84DRAFT_1708032 [Gymnopilus junonius]